MKQQKLYDANYDKSLLRDRQIAKDLCYDFNQFMAK
ncbi:MAG: maltose acetyltransferase domain-containing protein [Eggerthia catenaformis]